MTWQHLLKLLNRWKALEKNGLAMDNATLHLYNTLYVLKIFHDQWKTEAHISCEKRKQGGYFYPYLWIRKQFQGLKSYDK